MAQVSQTTTVDEMWESTVAKHPGAWPQGGETAEEASVRGQAFMRWLMARYAYTHTPGLWAGHVNFTTACT